MVRGSYQNWCDRLPIHHVSFAFACREYHHIISHIIRSCCIIHHVFPSLVTVIRPRSPQRLWVALLKTSCFFIIGYDDCIWMVLHHACWCCRGQRLHEEMKRKDAAGHGEGKRENERVPPAGGRAPFMYPRTNSYGVSPGKWLDMILLWDTPSSILLFDLTWW